MRRQLGRRWPSERGISLICVISAERTEEITLKEGHTVCHSQHVEEEAEFLIADLNNLFLHTSRSRCLLEDLCALGNIGESSARAYSNI